MQLENVGNKKFLNKGRNAKCYILQNNNVFKKFNNPLELSEISRFKYFLEHANDSFCFPIDFVYDDHKFYGYVMKKAMGDVLEKKFADSNLLDLSTNSIHLENNIKNISNDRIVMYDLHEENVLYDANKLTVIDPDDYGINVNYAIKEIENKNIGFYRILINRLFRLNLEAKRSNNYILNKIAKYTFIDIPASSMIVELKDEMDKYYKEDIKTVNDIKKVSR